MIDRTGAWPRRRILAGMIGTTAAALGAPAILRAAPTGTPVKVGGTLSLTGFLAQTAVVHKIASEIMVEEINGRICIYLAPKLLNPLERVACARAISD